MLAPDQPDVLFSLTGDVYRNSRALRQLRALASSGWSVDVLSLGTEYETDEFEKGIRIHTLPHPSGSGRTFFSRVFRLFREAALRIPARAYHASDLYVLPAMH